MNNLARLLAIFFIAIASVTNAQTKIPSADDVLKEAVTKATAENKNIFIIFHASWCGWCHKMEAAINDQSTKEYFEKNYIIRYLTVYESAGKENLENPGAEDLLVKYKGNGQGIPYWLVFDNNGNLLADSKIRPDGGGLEAGENTGCPAAAQEVANFINILKRTSSLKDTDLAVIEKRFLENDPR